MLHEHCRSRGDDACVWRCAAADSNPLEAAQGLRQARPAGHPHPRHRRARRRVGGHQPQLARQLQQVVLNLIVNAAEAAVTQDHAEVICLGCGGMAELEEKVRDRTGVPVVDGVTAAVTIAESLVRLGLSTSKVRTYARPRAKRVIGWPLTP